MAARIQYRKELPPSVASKINEVAAGGCGRKQRREANNVGCPFPSVEVARPTRKLQVKARQAAVQVGEHRSGSEEDP